MCVHAKMGSARQKDVREVARRHKQKQVFAQNVRRASVFLGRVGLSQHVRQWRSLSVSYPLLDRCVTKKNRFFVDTLQRLTMWMLVLSMLRFLGGVVLLYRAIRPGVVLLVVNLPARIVLLMIDLRPLLWREPAAVGRTVVANFTVDVRLSVLESSGLPWSQLS
jgi:hypothetical protein